MSFLKIILVLSLLLFGNSAIADAWSFGCWDASNFSDIDPPVNTPTLPKITEQTNEIAAELNYKSAILSTIPKLLENAVS